MDAHESPEHTTTDEFAKKFDAVVRRTNGATCSIKELATPEQIEEVRSTLLPRSYGYYMWARLQEAGHDDVMGVNWRGTPS
jgi:hypothetical protein